MQHNIFKPSQASIKKSVKLLQAGGVICFPTDTVYGIGCDANNTEAIERIYRIKRREKHKPLQILVPNLEMAKEIGVFNKAAEEFANKFWPGALTIVVPEGNTNGADGTVGTVGIRVPDNKWALEILNLFGRPVAATSANISKNPSPVRIEEIDHEILTSVEMVIDGGSCDIGISSTVVDATNDEVRTLRKGSIKLL